MSLDTRIASTVPAIAKQGGSLPSQQVPPSLCSWDVAFFSACDLSRCFQRIGKDFSIVQLTPGALVGRFTVVQLQGMSLLRLTTNKVLLLTGERGKDTTSFCLEVTGNSDDHRVQCQPFQQFSLYGFKQNLQEAHFQLSAGSTSILAITSCHRFNTFLTRVGQEHLLDQLMLSNCVQLDQKLHQSLSNHLCQIFQNPPSTAQKSRLAAQTILVSILSCLQSNTKQFVPFELSARDQLVQEMVSWGITHSNTPLTLDQVCQQLFTSRRTLILGSKENFGCGPMELLRIIRLQQVHHLLRSEQARQRAELHQVCEVAEYFGFRSRGHFARAYQQQFEESPRTTLLKSVA